MAELLTESRPGYAQGPINRWLLGRERVLRYGIAPAAVGITFALRILLTPILHDDSPYLLFVPAVLVAAGMGGWGPGLIATFLSALLGSFIVSTFPSLAPADILNVTAFTLIGVGIAWSGEQLQRSRIRAAGSTENA